MSAMKLGPIKFSRRGPTNCNPFSCAASATPFISWKPATNNLKNGAPRNPTCKCTIQRVCCHSKWCLVERLCSPSPHQPAKYEKVMAFLDCLRYTLCLCVSFLDRRNHSCHCSSPNRRWVERLKSPCILVRYFFPLGADRRTTGYFSIIQYSF